MCELLVFSENRAPIRKGINATYALTEMKQAARFEQEKVSLAALLMFK